MAAISNKVVVARELRAIIQAMPREEGQTILDLEHAIAEQLGVNQRTLNGWTVQSGIKRGIPTEYLLGLIWLAVVDLGRDLDWLVSLLRHTDLLVVDYPNRD